MSNTIAAATCNTTRGARRRLAPLEEGDAPLCLNAGA